MPKFSLIELPRIISMAFSFGDGRGSSATGDVELNMPVVFINVSCLMSSSKPHEPVKVVNEAPIVNQFNA